MIISFPKDDDLLIQKLKENFTEDQQYMFIQSFSMYLQYDQETDYIIDLDNVYKWIGFSQKVNCKKLLVKHFEENKDYKVSYGETALPIGKAVSSQNGGQNKETILLNIKTFKKLCMKSSTKKADEIHDYYIKMERILQDYMYEQMEVEKKRIKETVLLESNDNKKVLYLLWISEFLLKFGWSDNINQRILDHKRTYGEQSTLVYVTECSQNKLLETHMKQHNEINNCIVHKVYNKKNRTELIDTSKINVDQVIKIIEFLKNKLLQDYEMYKMEHEKKMKEEETKQKLIDLEIKKIDLEMRKLDLQTNTFKHKNIKKEYIDAYEFIDKILEYKEDNKLVCKEVWKKFNEWCSTESKKKIKQTILEDLIETHFDIEEKQFSSNNKYCWKNICFKEID